ncbi:uncharacterized protein LOC116424097 [Nomia melanderi]|uniref:uncharacterized protein LOC116424097 n=1 Tax=Nomia melanderi TaxID=2448451 RepID=UPI0013041A9A|nr:uncharacterized protein LOC116424097 [Nomia melanderi]
MEKITHLWNVNQFITKLNGLQKKNLQPYYIQRCRRLSKGVNMPMQNFGPSVMCPYCGSLWNTMDYSIRISKGRPISRSIRKVIRSINNNDKSTSKFHRSLAKKCLRNKMNKLILKCSVCLQTTKMPLNKPPREKLLKLSTKDIETSQKRKKKKRKTKDKTAGLNISGILNSSVETVTEGLKETPAKKIGTATSFITSSQKIKKLNLNRLKDIVNHGATPTKRKSLHSFLTQLC